MASLLSSVTTVLTIVVVYAKHQELSCLKKSVCLLHLIGNDAPLSTFGSSEISRALCRRCYS